MYLRTAHNTLLLQDAEGNLSHAPFVAARHWEYIRIESESVGEIRTNGGTAFQLLKSDGQGEFAKQYLLKGPDGFVRAIGSSDAVKTDQPSALWWEHFVPIPESSAPIFAGFLDSRLEAERFAAQVEKLRNLGEPVRVYCGAGAVPRDGFLNLDIVVESPKFAYEHHDEYFIFPFADGAWPIPNDSVDFIFDEDFIEHVSQLTQIQYLAETRRVLKVGAIHRVNTPNFLQSMKVHSDFSRGFPGVYTGELQWGHIALFSPKSLEEAARLVGHSDVVFCSKGQSISPFAIPDHRPGPDRDEALGNIYADLVK